MHMWLSVQASLEGAVAHGMQGEGSSACAGASPAAALLGSAALDSRKMSLTISNKSLRRCSL
jgi:hypothetical protein